MAGREKMSGQQGDTNAGRRFFDAHRSHPFGTGQRAARPLKGRAPQAAAPQVVFLFTAEAQRKKQVPGISLRRNVLRPLLSRLPAARQGRALRLSIKTARPKAAAGRRNSWKALRVRARAERIADGKRARPGLLHGTGAFVRTPADIEDRSGVFDGQGRWAIWPTLPICPNAIRQRRQPRSAHGALPLAEVTPRGSP